MKKKINTILSVLIITLSCSLMQAQSLPCVRHISTNPANPTNLEWPALFPGKTNSYFYKGSKA